MNEEYSTSVRNLPEYYERAATSIPWEPAALHSPDRTPTRLLSLTEKGTVRVVTPTVLDVEPGHSVLHEAAVRLAMFQDRGLLQYMSGHSIATTFESVLRPQHPSRFGHWGFELLLGLDAADLVEVSIDAEPLPGCNAFRRMRLRDRVGELTRTSKPKN